MKSTVNSTKVKGSKLPKPNNVVTVPYGEDIDFFRGWCIFLRPFVKMTDRETDVMASFLKQRYELSKVISDQGILDSQLMSKSTANKVIEECNISPQHFYVIMGNLRKNKIVTDTGLNPRLIPNIRVDDNGIFQLMVLFKRNPKTNDA